MSEERVQKILARAGYGSRRASEELITAGRVKINGKTAVLGSKADPQHDTITIDNQPIAREQAPVYIAINKPQGVLSEVSPEEPRQTVRDLVPVPGHMFIVGRLDMESEGLILLTNDGELANRLSHPRYGHEKEYRVLVGARPDDHQLEAWRHGVVLEDGYRTAPAQVKLDSLAGKGAWLQVILHEGRKRQIREMGRQTGLPVFRILRIRIGTLLLGDLKPGIWRELRPDEIRALKASTSMSGPKRGGMRAPRRAPQREPHSAERANRGTGPSYGEGAPQPHGTRPHRAPGGKQSEGQPEFPHGRAPGGKRSDERPESPRGRAPRAPGSGTPRPPRSEAPRSGTPRPPRSEAPRSGAPRPGRSSPRRNPRNRP